MNFIDNKIDLLIVYCVDKKILNSLKYVTNYPEMKTYFFHKALMRSQTIQNKKIAFVYLPGFWNSKSKNKFQEFKTLIADQGIDISQVDNLLFALLGSLKVFRQNSLTELCNSITGKIYKFEDKDIRCSPYDKIQTIGHYQQAKQTNNFLNAGFTVARDVFVPIQDFDSIVFKVHVDHDLEKRENIFPEIKTILFELKNRIMNHAHWQDLEVYYHETICEIEDIGHSNYGHLTLDKLAKVYGACHLAFLSHTETLGQYPLEMLSCGVNVCARKTHLMHNELPIIDVDGPIDYDMLLDNQLIQTSIGKNRESVSNFSFDNYVHKIIQFIFKV